MVAVAASPRLSAASVLAGTPRATGEVFKDSGTGGLSAAGESEFSPNPNLYRNHNPPSRMRFLIMITIKIRIMKRTCKKESVAHSVIAFFSRGLTFFREYPLMQFTFQPTEWRHYKK
jgi:hypothetical protein